LIEDIEYKNAGDSYYNDTTLYFHSPAFSVDSNNALKRAKHFAYVQNLDSLLMEMQKEPVKEAKESWLVKILASGITEVILWVLAVLFIVFIIYRLFFADGFFLQGQGKRTVSLLQKEDDVLSVHADYDALVQQALLNNNYRLAVRYL